MKYEIVRETFLAVKWLYYGVKGQVGLSRNTHRQQQGWIAFHNTLIFLTEDGIFNFSHTLAAVKIKFDSDRKM